MYSKSSGSEQKTQWLPVSVDGATFAKALGQLSSLRKVNVNQYDISRGTTVGYGFSITYTEDVGDVPALEIEFSAAGQPEFETHRDRVEALWQERAAEAALEAYIAELRREADIRIQPFSSE